MTGAKGRQRPEFLCNSPNSGEARNCQYFYKAGATGGVTFLSAPLQPRFTFNCHLWHLYTMSKPSSGGPGPVEHRRGVFFAPFPFVSGYLRHIGPRCCPRRAHQCYSVLSQRAFPPLCCPDYQGYPGRADLIGEALPIPFVKVSASFQTKRPGGLDGSPLTVHRGAPGGISIRYQRISGGSPPSQFGRGEQ